MSDYMTEIRAGIAENERREQARIARLVAEANRDVNARAEAREATERQQQQAQEAAVLARAAQKEAKAKDDAQRAFLSAGGQPADFEAWYIGERQRLVTEKIARDRQRAELSYRSSF